MDFTELYRQSSSLVTLSPGAHFILTAVQDRVIVRRADTFQITRTWLVDPSPTATQATLVTSKQQKTSSSNASNPPTDLRITHLAWSCDSEYILAACAKRGAVHIFKLRDEEWSGRIDAGAEGLVRAEWGPDGRTVLCFSEWGLRVTVWSLVSGTATYIQHPIHPDRGYAFRSDGRYFVLAERHKSKDTLGVYDASESYKLVRHFPLPTSSLSSLCLSPSGNYIAVWEGPLEYKLHVVTLAGNLVTSFTPEQDPGFGIRSVAWHPNGLFLAVGGWDDKIHVLDCLSWSPVALLELNSRVLPPSIVWREPGRWLEATEGRGFLSYEKLQGIQTLLVTKPDLSRPYPKCGVVQLEFNIDGTLLLVRFESTSHVLHIFDFPSPDEQFQPQLRTVLIHSQPILYARWNPVRRGNLALCCGNQAVFTWSDEWVSESGAPEDMAECIGVPAKQFETKDVKWAPDGKGVVLLDREQFCCAFEVEDES
ncbi:WD repeat-containing protein 8 [Coprinopsis sp. MPI-PUGE-AT-0042]|nr:WD repeat-containing protein 8 [Coprinopsis sp. MPI-PUGE-AT-0042]